MAASSCIGAAQAGCIGPLRHSSASATVAAIQSQRGELVRVAASRLVASDGAACAGRCCCYRRSSRRCCCWPQLPARRPKFLARSSLAAAAASATNATESNATQVCRCFSRFGSLCARLSARLCPRPAAPPRPSVRPSVRTLVSCSELCSRARPF